MAALRSYFERIETGNSTMFMCRIVKDEAVAGLTIQLEDGLAERMGDGVFVVVQTVNGVTHRVTLTGQDLDLLHIAA